MRTVRLVACRPAAIAAILSAAASLGVACAAADRGPARCAPIPLPAHPGPHRCVLVPETKEIKETVYETKLVPYCLPDPTCPGCCENDCKRPCPKCEACPRWKKVLVKRTVVVGETCCYKCVAEPCGTCPNDGNAVSGAAGKTRIGNIPPVPLPTEPPAPAAPPAEFER